MTRDEVLALYDVRDGRIVSPGMFEGEPLFIVSLWNDAMNGLEDEELYDGDTPISVFIVDDAMRAEWPEIAADTTEVWMYETETGFVVHDEKTEVEAEQARYHLLDGIVDDTEE